MAAKPLILIGIRQKVHYGIEFRIWKDLWLPTNHARPARPIAPVVHPMLTMRGIIIGTPKDGSLRCWKTMSIWKTSF